MKRRWRYRLRSNFFGLSDQYIANVYEQFFLLKYHGGWSFIEAYNLPIKIREWFLKRLIKQKKEESDAMNKASKR
jgi:hypothetical protein